MNPFPNISSLCQKRLVNGALLLASVAFSYLLIELLYSFYLSYNPYRFQCYDSPYSAFDPEVGYSLLPGEKRCLSFYKGNLLWSTTIRPNNLGYNSALSYSNQKPTTQTKRFMVLGDSFTAGDNMDVPWVDKFNELIAPLQGQAYAFSQQAIGLFNWHGIFFNQIVPHFDFDALIIACYHNDLSRVFTIFHTQGDYVYYTRTPSPPTSQEEFIHSTLPRMIPLIPLVDHDKANRLISGDEKITSYTWRWAGYNFQLARKAFTAIFFSKHDEDKNYEYFFKNPPLLSLAEIASSDPEFFNLTKLWDILNWCKNNNKPVIICSIPDIERIKPYIESGGQFLGENQRNLESIAHHYGLTYFDGYKIFLGKSVKDIRRNYWPQEELHWGQDGAHYFARCLADFTKNSWASLFPPN